MSAALPDSPDRRWATLSSANTDRYVRQRAIEGFDQARLAALSVAVVGAGAIGNEVVKNLVLLGVGRVSVFDFDTVEVHNLTRSILLREADIGLAKAACVAARAGDVDPSVRVVAVPGDIADTLTPSRLLGHDLLIGAVDNFEARIRINQMCLLTGRPWVNAAIDSRHVSVEVFAFRAGGDPAADGVAGDVASDDVAGDDVASECACYECTLPESVYQRLAERRSCGGLRRAAARERLVPTTTITASLAGALAVNEGLRITGCDRRLASAAAPPSERIFLDALTGRGGRTTLTAGGLCAGCGLTPRSVRWYGPVASANEAAVLLHELAPDTSVQLSDALVWSCACRQCGRLPSIVVWEGRRAASLDDSIATCPRCGNSSVDIEIRDTVPLDQLCERFGDQALPVVWLRCGEHHLEVAADSLRRPT